MIDDARLNRGSEQFRTIHGRSAAQVIELPPENEQDGGRD